MKAEGGSSAAFYCIKDEQTPRPRFGFDPRPWETVAMGLKKRGRYFLKAEKNSPKIPKIRRSVALFLQII